MTGDRVTHGLEDVLVAETELSHIDGEAGQLVVGGYPIEELATNATYEEAVYLLLYGQLPTAAELESFTAELADRRRISDEVRATLERATTEGESAMDALRMGVAAANIGTDGSSPQADAKRVVAVLPTVAATYWRYRHNRSPVAPRTDLGHAANYLYMLRGEEPDDQTVRGLESYLVTVIDHGLNASTFTARAVVSTESDVVSAVTAAVGSLKGPLHGGAPGPVLDMLLDVAEGGDPERYVADQLAAGNRLMGFGHRVYRVRDPRSSLLATVAGPLYEAAGEGELFDTIRSFEDVALDALASHRPDRRLATNVEFYTAALLYIIDVPKPLFTATFAVSRVGGWVAHCLEQLENNRLIRPGSVYVGDHGRTWSPVDER